jgi:hypothetical protein
LANRALFVLFLEKWNERVTLALVGCWFYCII